VYRHYKNIIASLLCMSCGWPVCTLVTAAEPVRLQVRVLDQHQQPVADAIVIDPDTPATSIPTDIAVMDQQNKQFKPYVLAITRGQKVAFPNSDNIRHHVSSFSEAKRFEIKLYADTPEAPIEFERGGIVVLGCNIHDSMLGYIFVSDWQHFAQADAQGIATFNTLTSAPKKLTVWHPEQGDPTRVQTLETVTWDASNSTTIVIQRQPKPAPVKSSRFRYDS
jgi:plastocyanin